MSVAYSFPAPEPTLLERLKAIVGEKGWTDAADELDPHLREPRRLFVGKSPLLLRPANTREVSEIVTACAEAGVPIVPQGGNTGLCGGATPDASGSAVLISTSRMNAIRELDPINHTITVEAGCILQNIQQAADDADRLFPLSLAAEGSCQIGGNLSTNAGGTAVLRYGNARDLVLGLEVVLPDGRIWNGLRSLRKDNTGYDLKHLFVGAEGTLGIITAAVLKLYPKPRDVATAFAAVRDVEAIMELLARARGHSGDSVTTLEFMPHVGLKMVLEHGQGIQKPFDQDYDQYVLIEFSGGGRANDDGGSSRMREAMETLLEEAFEEGLVLDAVLASSAEQAKQLWNLREWLPEVQIPEGGSIKHDVTVPISKVAEFLKRANAAVTERLPGIRPVAFGHIGDGNIHYNLSQPKGADTAEYLARWHEFNRIVHDIVVGMRGSISAEHGIGQLKVEELEHYKDSVEIELMHRVKQALDPKGIMNPGKVVAPKDGAANNGAAR